MDNMQKEFIDIISKQDYLDTGKIKVVGAIGKTEAHESGEFHQAGHVWIYNSKGEVLLQKRSQDKDSYPGLWDISAAGHISVGETMDEGILRELEEELGIAIENNPNVNQLEPIFSYIEDVKRTMRGKPWHNHELNSVFLFKYDGRAEDLIIQEEEVEEIKFIPIEQFEQEINDPEFKEKYVPHRAEYFEKLFIELKKRSKK